MLNLEMFSDVLVLYIWVLAPFMIFYTLLCMRRGWELARYIFLNFLARWIPLWFCQCMIPAGNGRVEQRGKALSFCFLLLAVPLALQRERWGKKAKTRTPPGLFLRSTVLTMSGSGCDGAYHAAPATGLWARILVTTVAEQVHAT